MDNLKIVEDCAHLLGTYFEKQYAFGNFSKGIRTSVHYKPLHLFSLHKKQAKTLSSLKVSKKLHNEILSLPMFPSMTKTQQNIVISTIKNVVS